MEFKNRHKYITAVFLIAVPESKEKIYEFLTGAGVQTRKCMWNPWISIRAIRQPEIAKYASLCDLQKSWSDRHSFENGWRKFWSKLHSA